MGAAHYSIMIFPQKDGTFTMNYTISTGYAQSWTSPEAPVAGATYEEARANARAEITALKRMIEGDN